MKNLSLITISIFTLIIQTGAGFAQNDTESLWVTFEDLSNVPEVVNGRLQSNSLEVQDLINRYNIISVEQALPASRNKDLQKVYQVDCLCNQDALAEEMKRSTSLSDPFRAPEYELLSTPDDYSLEFSNDYALDLINAKKAWDYSTGDTSVILGISDGSFFNAHEELQGEYVSIQNDVNVSTQFYYHGTAVATTAGGATNNGVGKSSIGYNCKLALNTIGYNQILQLSYNGARVINISWSVGCGYNSYYQAIIDEVYNNGTIVVAAAGNGSTCGGPEALVYPAALDHVIAVSSVGPNDNHERTIGNPATTHQHNKSVDICAPGYDVALTVAPGWYLTGNGTSFAAPYVTGTIGLMLSIKPCLTYEDVLEILQATAVNIDHLNPEYAGKLGAGRLDAGAALAYTYDIACHGPNGGNNGNGGNGGNPHAGNGDDGNNGHGNDNGNNDPSNPGQGNGNNNGSDDGSGDGRRLTGTDDGSDFFFDEFEAKVFPNPTSGAATVTWNNDQALNIQVISLNGSVIANSELPSGTNRYSLDLQEPGMYMINLTDTNGQPLWTDKVIKL